LRQQLQGGSVDVSIDVPAEIDGTNVIARPTSGTCRTLSGGHYDTVPWAPGAVDNASGAALVLDLARANAPPGSRQLLRALQRRGGGRSAARTLSAARRRKSELKAYFNYDVVAVARIDVIGDPRRPGGHTRYAGGRHSAPAPRARQRLRQLPVRGASAIMLTVDDLGSFHTERTFDFANGHRAARRSRSRVRADPGHQPGGYASIPRQERV
jgi:hypothetical protein